MSGAIRVLKNSPEKHTKISTSKLTAKNAHRKTHFEKLT